MKRYAIRMLQIALISLLLNNEGVAMDAPAAVAGVRTLPTHHSVAQTLDRLTALLQERGVTIFARIDFSADAAKNGLSMPPEQQLIFGNPKAGTPLMLTNPTAALDLPIRVICWQDEDGKTWLAYVEPAYTIERYGLAEKLTNNLAAVVPLIEKAAAP